MTEYFNRSEDQEKRRELRREMPPAEKCLWARVRAQQVYGWKFHRQYGVGPYVLDFYCPSRKFAVELDGDSHAGTEAQVYDRVREEYLRAFGIRVVRFANPRVFTQIEAVIAAIIQAGEAPLAHEIDLPSDVEDLC